MLIKLIIILIVVILKGGLIITTFSFKFNSVGIVINLSGLQHITLGTWMSSAVRKIMTLAM